MAVKIKASGLDGIIITGQAEKPSYLYIREGNVEIKDAAGLKQLWWRVQEKLLLRGLMNSRT